ncbi:MAG: type II toxin-antitoxin system VapC family toxin [Myxococcaceae bacterium]
MIAVDTNILVYAHRAESHWHSKAAECVRSLAEGKGLWAIPWPCVHEFFAKVTHPRIFLPPTAPQTALAFIEALAESPSLSLLSEAEDHFSHLKELVTDGEIKGPRIHDARIAAICLSHGIRELLTADRDFGRFPRLTVRNPVVAKGSAVIGP